VNVLTGRLDILSSPLPTLSNSSFGLEKTFVSLALQRDRKDSETNKN
jgi:hypothetical protein